MSDRTTVMLIGKPGEDLFGISCEELVIQKNHTYQTILPPEILKIKGQTRVLQLKIGFKDDLIIKTDRTRPGLHPEIRGGSCGVHFKGNYAENST